MTSPRLSIIIPVFNEEDLLPQLFSRLAAVTSQLRHDCGIEERGVEIVLVNDGVTADSEGSI